MVAQQSIVRLPRANWKGISTGRCSFILCPYLRRDDQGKGNRRGAAYTEGGDRPGPGGGLGGGRNLRGARAAGGRHGRKSRATGVFRESFGEKIRYWGSARTPCAPARGTARPSTIATSTRAIDHRAGVFLDTGYLVALEDADDENHPTARALRWPRAHAATLTTTSYVLDEVVTFFYVQAYTRRIRKRLVLQKRQGAEFRTFGHPRVWVRAFPRYASWDGCESRAVRMKGGLLWQT